MVERLSVNMSVHEKKQERTKAKTAIKLGARRLIPDCKVLFLRGEQKISSNFLRGSGAETCVSKLVQTDT